MKLLFHLILLTFVQLILVDGYPFAPPMNTAKKAAEAQEAQIEEKAIYINVPTVQGIIDKYNINMSAAKLITLFSVSIIEFFLIITLICVYRMDYFHKISLSRIEETIEKIDEDHEKKLIAMGLKSKD